MTPVLTGKTVIVTGANSGVGLATAQVLGRYGARVVLAVRDTAKGASAAATVPGPTEVRHLDLADLASIRRFAAAWTEPIHLLINNAGTSAPERERTADGFELHFGTNHLGPFALTNLLLPHVTGRVVSVSSQAERRGRIDFDDLDGERTRYRPSRAYATSKLANILFSSELQRRLNAAGSKVLAVTAHPGFVATHIYDGASRGTKLMLRLFAQGPEEGALPVLHAATGSVPGDSFIGPRHWMHMRGGAEPIGRSRTARNEEVARRLWDASEKLTGVSFSL
ncbi:oxidoreductase [Streptomyces mexicanus]|uniref:oxidoreductase n=1 Tax=Streptomyces mexicanus TaxID=178566 RepID=UPI0031EF25AF